MKKLLLLLFSLILSFNSYGEWTEITKSADNSDTLYIDINSIKERDGYVNCSSMGFQYLQMTFYKHSMGSGESETITPPSGWHYASPDSVGEVMIDFVCKYL